MPQNMKTEPLALPEDLPELTPQEMEFVLAMETGDDQSKAYLKAYEATGYSRAALTVRACRKAAEPHIKAWRAVLQREGFNRAVLTKDEHVRRLRALAARAEGSGNYGAAVNAEVNAGKAEGHYVEKHEDVTSQTWDEVLASLRALPPEQRQEIIKALQPETMH